MFSIFVPAMMNNTGMKRKMKKPSGYRKGN
ncbi:MAG: hypothetical protein FD123_59 [Bacteroidetes bacterium]|nr:MAG: hypothetical protein FD123_59 [Bacteroidota bacterium]